MFDLLIVNFESTDFLNFQCLAAHIAFELCETFSFFSSNFVTWNFVARSFNLDRLHYTDTHQILKNSNKNEANIYANAFSETDIYLLIFSHVICSYFNFVLFLFTPNSAYFLSDFPGCIVYRHSIAVLYSERSDKL